MIKNIQKKLKILPPMAWACSKCTFNNSPAQISECQMCCSPRPSTSAFVSSSPSSYIPFSKWSCNACTFLNPHSNSVCQICGTTQHLSSLSSRHRLDFSDSAALMDPSVGSVFLPLQRAKRKYQDSDEDSVSLEVSEKIMDTSKYKILSYNVWFREDVEMEKRMKAIGHLVELHSPDIICFQEVTPNIYNVFEKFGWWKLYQCSVSSEKARSRPYFCIQLVRMSVKCFSCIPFKNSIMGRELCLVEVEVNGRERLFVATSHLESPCPAPPKWDQMFSEERVAQAKESLNYLVKKKSPNMIFCGDMNWDDKLDGRFPLPDGWMDAWETLRAGEHGWTYDTKSNPMLSGNRSLQKRLDRFLCSLSDFTLEKVDMIGVEEIPGSSYIKEKRVKGEVKNMVLPILPSDHYGLLLTFHTK